MSDDSVSLQDCPWRYFFKNTFIVIEKSSGIYRLIGVICESNVNRGLSVISKNESCNFDHSKGNCVLALWHSKCGFRLNIILYRFLKNLHPITWNSSGNIIVWKTIPSSLDNRTASQFIGL